MKKIIALVVALVMMAAMAVPAFAEVVSGSNATASETTLSSGTVISYGTSQQYTVTIPEAINFNNGSVDTEEDSPTKGLITVADTLTISDYSLAADKELTICINSAKVTTNYTNKTDNKWYLFEDGTDTDATDVEYFVKADGANIARGGQIASADTTENNNDVVVALAFSTYGTSQVASFTDTISYTVTIE